MVEAPEWAVTGQSSVPQVLFLPTSLGEAEQTFIITCDNCQVKELVTSGGLACVPGAGAAWAPGLQQLLPWRWHPGALWGEAAASVRQGLARGLSLWSQRPAFL